MFDKVPVAAMVGEILEECAEDRLASFRDRKNVEPIGASGSERFEASEKAASPKRQRPQSFEITVAVTGSE